MVGSYKISEKKTRQVHTRVMAAPNASQDLPIRGGADPGGPRGLRDRPSHLSRDVAAATSRGLTWGYVLGLGLLALLTISGGWIISSLLHGQSEHAAIINQAGAQRMLSQRIAAFAEAAVDPAAPDHATARQEVALATARMAASHAALLSRAMHPETGTPALKAHYLTQDAPLDHAVTQFLELTAGLVSSPDGREQARRVRAIALHPLLPQLHQAVGLHEAAARAQVHHVGQIHLLLLAAALLLMLVEVLFVFRPLVRRAAALAGRLRHEADTDPLTGLMNRRAITTALTTSMAQGESLAVIAVDLDHFKEANDAEGHAAGDALLCVTAERIKANIRHLDMVGRVGGDEFVIFLHGLSNEEAALAAAGRIHDALHLPVSHQGRLLRLGATIGVALAPMDADRPEAILRAADEALIRAKRKARGSIGRATPADTVRAEREASIIRSLAQIAGGGLPGLTAHLQPIISLKNGAVVAVEALARWQCPQLGQVPPDEFFPIAARAGLAAQISNAARGHALAAYVGLRREGLQPGRLALNLSAAELLQQGVVERLERQCADVGLDLDALTIEITEDALLERVAATTISRLAVLRGGGAKLALDDFGTGTSGLAQLLRLPLDEIKLDRTFTHNLGMDGRAERIVEGTIRLADSMGMHVVAEGIEDEAQARKLHELGCEMGQGWLYARAMSLPDLRDWLGARQAEAGNVIALRRPAV